MIHIQQALKQIKNKGHQQILMQEGFDNMSDPKNRIKKHIQSLFEEYSDNAICFFVPEISELDEFMLPHFTDLDKHSAFNFPYPVTWIEMSEFDGIDHSIYAFLCIELVMMKKSILIYLKSLNSTWKVMSYFYYEHDDGTLYISSKTNKYAAWALATISGFFSSLKSSTIKKNNIKGKKAKEILNRSKKLPQISSYYTLELNIPNIRQESEDLGGTHASPRAHHRRGHYRKLKNGRVIWVKAHTVGKKELGIIHKNYLIKASNSVN